MKATKDFHEELEMSEEKKSDSDNKQKNIIIAVIISAMIGAAAGIGLSMQNRNAERSENKDIVVVTTTMMPTSAPSAEPTTVPVAEPTQIPTVRNIPTPAETTDLIDIIAAARNNGMRKRCYLTFDDGPSAEVTNQVLDILKKHNIKATFFQVGSMIRKYPDVTRRVHNEGHLLANHSYNHSYSEMYASEETFKNEIKACEMEITAVLGEPLDFKLMRFPGGGYNAGPYGEQKQLYKQTLADMGYYYCDWNVLNGDAEGEKKDADGLAEFFKNSAQPYIAADKNLIVLMHDTDVKQATADSLEDIIVYMVECGYTFHRLDDIG